MRFAEANETYQRRSPSGLRSAARRRRRRRCGSRASFVPNDPDPALGDRLAEHPALHAALRPTRRGVARAHDRAVAGRALGDRRRRPALRLQAARGPALVGRHAADRARCRVRDQARARPAARRARRPRSTSCSRTARTTASAGTSDAVGSRRPRARRPDRRVPARRACAVLPERDEPSRRRPAAAPCDRARRRRLDGDRQQVVSGPFQIAERDEARLVLERRADYANVVRPRQHRTRRVRARQHRRTRCRSTRTASVDMVTVRYTPRLADRVVERACTRHDRSALPPGPPISRSTTPTRWSRTCDFRRALAHSIDRDALGEHLPENLLVATGGLVPPALQGHTPDIVPRFDPDLARALLAESGVEGTVRVAGLEDWADIIELLARGWTEVLGLRVETPTWTPDQAWQTAAPVGGVHRADRRHRLAPRLRRSGVLPAAAAALGVEDERGRLRVRAVRRADRAGAAGALATASGSSCTTPPTGWRSPSRRR